MKFKHIGQQEHTRSIPFGYCDDMAPPPLPANEPEWSDPVFEALKPGMVIEFHTDERGVLIMQHVAAQR